MKTVMKDIFLKLMFNILENYVNIIVIYQLYQKNFEKLVTNLYDKTEYAFLIRYLMQA